MQRGNENARMHMLIHRDLRKANETEGDFRYAHKSFSSREGWFTKTKPGEKLNGLYIRYYSRFSIASTSLTVR